MSPHDHDEHDEVDDVDEKTQEQMRGLLAAAAGRDEEMPPGVADRLDGVLADLVREREAAGLEAPAEAAAGPAPHDEVAVVTDLGSRRRRWGPRLLLAAATVSVLALGVGVSLDDLTGGAGESATSDSAADGAAGGLAQPERSAAAPMPAQDEDGTTLSRSAHPPHVRSGSLEADLQRIEDTDLAVPVAGSSRRWQRACVRPETGTGDEWLPVRFDGRPAVLVLRAPDGGRRTADVFACGSADTPAASATLKAR
jgi:hypothetical protein